MPLTAKGQEILAKMKQEYGEEKGTSVFYASANAGKITGVHDAVGVMDALVDMCARHDASTAEREEFQALIAEQKEDLKIAERLANMYTRDGKTKEAQEQHAIAKTLREAISANVRKGVK